MIRLVTLFFLFSYTLYAQTFTITPQTTIYFDKENRVTKTAAQELATYLAPVIGKMPQYSAVQPSSISQRKIILAGSDTTVLKDKKLSFALHRLKEDGFILYITPDTLYIVSNNDRGVLYGTYYFLEKYVGYRFLSPDFTYTPPPHKLTLQPVLDIQEPAFAYREIFTTESDDWKYALQNRLNGRLGHRTLSEYQNPRFGRGVNIFNMFTPFALVPDEKYHCNGQLIYSDHEVQQIAAKKTGEKIAELVPAKEDYLYIQHEDRNSFCPKDGKTAQEATAAFLRYGIYIARHAEAAPGHRFLLEAYQWTREPPETFTPLPKNISVMFSTIEADFAKPLKTSENAAILNDLKAWRRYTDSVIVWHYNTNFSGYFQPHPNLYALAEDIKDFAKLPHVKGLFLQGCYETPKSEFAALRVWVFAKLLWNPQLNVDKLIREFCRYYYGEAADAVYVYIHELHRTAKQLHQKLLLKTPPTAPYLSDASLDRYYQILDKGYAKVQKAPLFKAHLEEVYASLDYVRLLNCTDEKKRAVSRKRFLHFLQTHPKIENYAEGAQIDSLKQIIHMKRQKPKAPKESRRLQGESEWRDFQEYTLKLCCAKIEQDPKASDKIAATMRGNQGEWGFQLDVNTNLPKGKWTIYARAKITLNPGHTLLDKSKVALFFGIYPTLIKGAWFIAQFTPGEYRTVKLGTIDTRKTDAGYIWISPPENDTVQKLWIDRIFAVKQN